MEDHEYEPCEKCGDPEGVAEFMFELDELTWLTFSCRTEKFEETTMCVPCIFENYGKILKAMNEDEPEIH